MSGELNEFFEQVKLREETEHRDVLLALKELLKRKEGVTLIRYLFKSFDVGEVPGRNLEGTELHDYLGFLRAGNSIYKISCEADFEKAGSILASVEKERYNDRREQHRIYSNNRE